MKFNARLRHSPAERAEFVDWLIAETTSTLKRANGDDEAFRAYVFLAVNRAYEAGLLESELAQTIGKSIARAGLCPEEEARVLYWLEFLAPIAQAAQRTAAARASRGEPGIPESPQTNKRPWWKFWS